MKPAPNFPLDVYFLMDVSYSMKNDLVTMKLVTLKVGKCYKFMIHTCIHNIMLILYLFTYVCEFTNFFNLLAFHFLSLIAKVLEQITKNYTLGFGSFVDKPTDPYIDRNIDKYVNICNLFARA